GGGVSNMRLGNSLLVSVAGILSLLSTAAMADHLGATIEAPGDPVWTIAAACIASHAPPVAERARSYPVPASAGILPLTGLGAMAEVMVGENDGDHCLADWDRADADTGVVAPLTRHLAFLPLPLHCLPRAPDR